MICCADIWFQARPQALLFALAFLLASMQMVMLRAAQLQDEVIQVHPGESIQAALDRAANSPSVKRVEVYPGEYRPESPRTALLWFNRKHDGIHLKALGKVVLTAANTNLASPRSSSYPAVVSHVVYFGDGVSTNTILEGFTLTGANHFVTEEGASRMEPSRAVPRNLFFFSDGGAIKIFGRSYPRILRCEIVSNYASPCGAGVSIQHEGHNQLWVHLEDCIFRENRAQITGSAPDLLHGSAARVINCLFTRNVSNTGKDIIALEAGEPPFTNSGVVTIFQDSRAAFERCTLVGNRNGIDDLGGGSVYLRCLFVDNDWDGGVAQGSRYDIDLPMGGQIAECWFTGKVLDPRGAAKSHRNWIQAGSPALDRFWVPTNPACSNLGYRPLPEPPSPVRPATR